MKCMTVDTNGITVEQFDQLDAAEGKWRDLPHRLAADDQIGPSGSISASQYSRSSRSATDCRRSWKCYELRRRTCLTIGAERAIHNIDRAPSAVATAKIPGDPPVSASGVVRALGARSTAMGSSRSEKQGGFGHQSRPKAESHTRTLGFVASQAIDDKQDRRRRHVAELCEHLA
jgi:hypothetical protein